jgi:quinoprotein glucose dehydrogenase
MQPFPIRPEPLLKPLTESDVMNYPIASRGCRKLFEQSRHDGLYAPPSLRGTLQFPGVSGGFNWGSNSVDPHQHLFVGALLNFPWLIKLVP